MQQLSGLDASWLYLETETCFMQTGVIHTFDYPDDPNFSPLEATRAQFASRLAKVDPFRRKVVEVPFGLDHPYWIIDPDFDLNYHIRHITLLEPDNDVLLSEQIARIISRPLDRTRPLWEAYAIEGLSENRWAIFTKYHHSTLDGGAGILLLSLLSDPDPEARPIVPDVLIPDAEQLPSKGKMVLKGASGMIRYPLKAVRSQYDIVKRIVSQSKTEHSPNLSSLARSTINSSIYGPSLDDEILLPTRSAPPTPWNNALSGEYNFAFRSVPLKDIMALKNALGGTVNDVVMTICSGGLRRYLLDHNALPDEPLVALMPVSNRTGQEDAPWKNMISVAMTFVPTDQADAQSRFDNVKQSIHQAKTLMKLWPTSLEDMAELANPALTAGIAQLISRWKLSNYSGGPANLTISNVPGPRTPGYVSGAKMLNAIPVSLLNEGIGLNVTVLSYVDHLEFGLTSCKEAVPDLWHLMDCMTDEFEHLLEIAKIKKNRKK